MPDGAPIAWFPPRMKQFFAAEGATASSVRLLGTTPLKQPELDRFARHEWSIAFDATDFSSLGKSIARLENEQPLLAIYQLQIHASPDHPENQAATLGTSIILKR